MQTSVQIDDADAILRQLFTSTEYRRQPYFDKMKEAQRRLDTQYASKTKALLEDLFGDDFIPMRDLFAKEKRTFKEIYGKPLPVYKNLITYYGLVDHDQFKGAAQFDADKFNSIYARYEIKRTSNPYFIREVINKIDPFFQIEVQRGHSAIIYTGSKAQILAFAKFSPDEIVFAYPVAKGRHVFWDTKYVEIPTSQYTGARVFLLENLSLTMATISENKRVVLLSDRTWIPTVADSIEELKKMTINAPYPDFTRYAAHILWER